MIRKVIFGLVAILISHSVYSQGVYTVKEIVDKFEDVIFTEEIKTLIEMDEDGDFAMFKIEEKGNKPRYYDALLTDSKGSPEMPVNIIGNLYGYEKTYSIGSSPDDVLNEIMLINRVILNRTTKAVEYKVFIILKLSRERTVYYKSYLQ